MKLWLLFRKSVGRHWRGTTPLRLSFWRDGLIGMLILLAWAQACSVIFLQSYNPYMNLAGLSASYFATLGFLIWWAIGVWRSATAAGTVSARSRVFPSLAKLVIALLVIREVYIIPVVVLPGFASAISDIEEDPQWGPRGVRMGPTSTEVEIYGAITRSVPSELERMLDSHPKISLVRINSKGGRAGAAYKLRDVIRMHGLDTLVSEECNSFCVIAFLGGRHRLIEPKARMGFHGTRYGNQSDAVVDEKTRKEMEAAGVSSAFVEKAFDTPFRSIWYPSYEELKSAGVVTGLAPESDRKLPLQAGK